VKAGKVGESLTDLKAPSQFVTLAHTLAEMEATRAGKTLSTFEAEAVGDTLSATLSEVVA